MNLHCLNPKYHINEKTLSPPPTNINKKLSSTFHSHWGLKYLCGKRKIRMNISGTITGITYKPLLIDNLEEIDIKDFDVNSAPTICLLKNRSNLFSISKWVSPKRTRSYPFERVYNSLGTSKKITIIPVVKDEGAAGDRDFIQWDTVSLMSLLEVFVIFAYYDQAEINPRNNKKITNQQFNNSYVLKKINEIEQYHSSALHWNLNELKTNFHDLIDRTIASYSRIEKILGVPMHKISSIESFKNKIGDDVSSFMEFSREKAQKAQEREYVTIQPKESLSTLSKAKITITNYLGGKYFFTVDEIENINNTVYLIESKHSKNNTLPSKADIKDALLKLILYTNISEAKLNDKAVNFFPVLRLTSPHLLGYLTSTDTSEDRENFYQINKFNLKEIEMIETVVNEANKNNFIIQIQYQP